MDTQQEPPGKNFSIVRHIVFASFVMVFLIGGLGAWAATANLAGAVIAPGTFVVERNVKKVQHSYGGIVSEIGVKNGDRVQAGQVLMRFDATQIKAEIGIIRSQLTELVARSARLSAERDSRPDMVLPPRSPNRAPTLMSAAEGEIRLFGENKKTRESQKEQLGLRIGQLKEEIIGLTAQRDAKKTELGIIQRELEQVRMLHKKSLTPVSRVYSMEREETRLGGEHGGLLAQIARANGQISEINVQILAVDENARATAQRELRNIEARLSELAEREVAAKDKLNRIDIRSPQTGVVHELAVHTVGGVVTGAEQIMLIVPEEDSLTIQTRIAPTDIDQVGVGRVATLEALGLQPEGNAGAYGACRAGFSRRDGRSQDGPVVLHRARRDGREIPQDGRRAQARSRHARRSLHGDWGPHGAVLSRQAIHRSDQQGIP